MFVAEPVVVQCTPELSGAEFGLLGAGDWPARVSGKIRDCQRKLLSAQGWGVTGVRPLTPGCLHKAQFYALICKIFRSLLLLNTLAIWNLMWLAARVAEGGAFRSGERGEMRGSCSLLTCWPCCFWKCSGLQGPRAQAHGGAGEQEVEEVSGSLSCHWWTDASQLFTEGLRI